MKLNKIITVGLLCGLFCFAKQDMVVANAAPVDTTVISNNMMTQEDEANQLHQEAVTGTAIDTVSQGAIAVEPNAVTNEAIGGSQTVTGEAISDGNSILPAAATKVTETTITNSTVKMSGVKTTAQKTKKKYTATELKLMSCIIYCEAGCEPYAGKKAVGIVVMNRKRSSSFPNTIKGVIYQKHQFGPASNGSLKRALQRYESGKFNSATEKACIKAAKATLNGDKMVKYNNRSYNMKNYYFFSRRVAGARLTIRHHQFK